MKVIKYFLILFLIIFLAGCVKKEAMPREEMPAAVPRPVEKPEEIPLPTAPGVFEVDLTAEKIMVPDIIKIKKGTTVRWFNRDTKFYHNLVIYSAAIEKPRASDVIAQSGNINPGEYWEYVFEESGDYIVKDVYSGTMRGEITAEVISEILEKGEIIGRVSVE